jgi:hypothetical protein
MYGFILFPEVGLGPTVVLGVDLSSTGSFDMLISLNLHSSFAIIKRMEARNLGFLYRQGVSALWNQYAE